jgi:hypothetical protein
MSQFFGFAQGIWNNLQAGPAKTRAHFAISRDHIDNGDKLGSRFEAGQHYFQIIINEMFLANQRQWFVNYDPMAFVASSYIYDKQLATLPMVVGPSMLKQYEQEAPLGMIFQNTPASGLHPYQGGSMTLIIILNRLQRQNNADKLLQVVESISGAINPSVAFSAYLALARPIFDGVETLLGLQQTVPVLGYRTAINPAIGQVLEPTYYVLIDAHDQQIERDKFWVRNDNLYYGQTQDTATPYDENDFILFSIAQGEKRSDEHMLPFYPLWESTRDLASRPTGEGDHFWKEAKAQFNTIKRELLKSPDLTVLDSKRLRDQYFDDLVKLREETIKEGKLGKGQLTEAEAELREMAGELDKLDRPTI